MSVRLTFRIRDTQGTFGSKLRHPLSMRQPYF